MKARGYALDATGACSRLGLREKPATRELEELVEEMEGLAARNRAPERLPPALAEKDFAHAH